jgi:hypothetical protein
VSKALRTLISFDPTLLCPGIHPKEVTRKTHKHPHTRMFNIWGYFNRKTMGENLKFQKRDKCSTSRGWSTRQTLRLC